MAALDQQIGGDDDPPVGRPDHSCVVPRTEQARRPATQPPRHLLDECELADLADCDDPTS